MGRFRKSDLQRVFDKYLKKEGTKPSRARREHVKQRARKAHSKHAVWWEKEVPFFHDK